MGQSVNETPEGPTDVTLSGTRRQLAVIGGVGHRLAEQAELHFGVLVTPDPNVRAERLRRLSEF